LVSFTGFSQWRVEPWCNIPSCDGNSTQKRQWDTPQWPPLWRQWTPELDPRSTLARVTDTSTVEAQWQSKGMGQKIQRKPMARTITRKTKGKANEKPKDAQPTRTKEGRELVPLVVGSYLTHHPSNVTCMQIVRSNSNRRFRASISRQRNHPLYSRG
jgi:hypothetical protein